MSKSAYLKALYINNRKSTVKIEKT